MTYRLILFLMLALLLGACGGDAETPTPTEEAQPVHNPTVPPTSPAAVSLSLANLPNMPDAIDTTPGDTFSMQIPNWKSSLQLAMESYQWFS